MRVDAFHYELPMELVAQRPSEERELARLLYLRHEDGAPEPRRVSELPDLLPAGALLVTNDTRVVPARLVGRKRDTRGRVELLLLQRTGLRQLEIAPGVTCRADVWKALGKGCKSTLPTDVELIRPGARPLLSVSGRPGSTPPSPAPGQREGSAVRLGDAAGPAGEVASSLSARLLGHGEDGLLEVALWTSSSELMADALRTFGRVPLPPYIKRDPEPQDADRYQTVYARHDGSVAAPTAGLHLTNALLDRVVGRGCDIANVTLHVGLATFQPVTAEDLDSHPMHSEFYVVPQATADAVARARRRGAPVVAVGTTTVRALESAADPERPGCVLPTSAETRLLVQPGYKWRIVDALLTNFHLPRSTLLALVCAFGGTERVLEAYRLAVRERFRFFSYGDAMLLWKRA